jgi:hypothetical protein
LHCEKGESFRRNFESEVITFVSLCLEVAYGGEQAIKFVETSIEHYEN